MINLEKVKFGQIGKIYKALSVDEYSTVNEWLNLKKISKDAELMVFKVGSKHLAFSKALMGFHHIAEGTVDGEAYLLTFCIICNSGMVMNPVVNNKRLHFKVGGLYNGMLLMADKETNSYWDHITGLCLSGKYENQQLELLQSHQILTAKEALGQYPDCLYGLPKMNVIQKIIAKVQHWKAKPKGNGILPPGFRSSMSSIDKRLPEMEMGLGVWVGQKAKFYPVKRIKENGNFLYDQFNDKNLFLYISPTTFTPSAMYLEHRISVSFKEDKVVFQNGDYIQAGNFYSSQDEKIPEERPHYIFSRWYGFVTTFPNCELD